MRSRRSMGVTAMVSELTNEQLINFVISRLEDIDASRENSMALVRLREAVVWLIEPNGGKDNGKTVK